MKVEIDDLIDSRPLGGLQMYVMVLCALAVLFDGYDLQVMALTVPALSKAWAMAPASFSVALSASLLGMGLGAAFIGPLGDRYGRRTVLAATLAIVGVSSIASAFAHNVTELAICRLFTGAALGASLANAYTLTADFMPRRRRASLITLAYCNTATGALVAALFAPYAINHYGWQAAFIVGGVLPLLLSVTLVTTAPESIKFLLHRRPQSKAIAGILRRIAPGVAADTVYLTPIAKSLAGSVRDLFTRKFRVAHAADVAGLCHEFLQPLSAGQLAAHSADRRRLGVHAGHTRHDVQPGWRNRWRRVAGLADGPVRRRADPGSRLPGQRRRAGAVPGRSLGISIPGVRCCW